MPAPKHAQVLSRLLEKLVGEMHIYVTLGDHKALEIRLEGKHIIIDIQNPIIVAELGLTQWLKGGGAGAPPSRTLTQLKKQGYSITIKHKGLKFDL